MHVSGCGSGKGWNSVSGLAAQLSYQTACQQKNGYKTVRTSSWKLYHIVMLHSEGTRVRGDKNMFSISVPHVYPWRALTWCPDAKKPVPILIDGGNSKRLGLVPRNGVDRRNALSPHACEFFMLLYLENRRPQ